MRGNVVQAGGIGISGATMEEAKKEIGAAEPETTEEMV